LTLGTVLKDIRESAGLRQVELAERLGQPQSFISKYESGERRLDVVEAVAVCEALGTHLASVITEFEKRMRL
jgi:transcriptional regulator with XRE-family HTH domain